MESPSSIFSPWAVFYTIAGSSAAALTGLTFVVITLMKDTDRRTGDGLTAVSTAIVVHFTAALMISGLLCAPWPSLLWPSALLALFGVVGVSYQFRLFYVARRARGDYTPDLEDWMWYNILPPIAYAIVLAGAIGLTIVPATAAYAPAAAVSLLILIGIHNSWDVVTFITITRPTPPEKK